MQPQLPQLLPAEPASIPENLVRRSLTFVFFCAGIGTITDTLTSNFVLNLLAIKLDAPEFYLGLLGFAYLGPLVLSLLTMSTIEQRGKRFVLLLWNAMQIPCVAALMAIPPLAERIPSWLTLVVLLMLVITQRAMFSLALTGWFPILQDLVADDGMGRFFAKLRSFWQIVQTCVFLLISWYCGKDPSWGKFFTLFAIATVFAIIKPLALMPIRELPPLGQVGAPPSISSRIKATLQQPKLRRFIIYTASLMLAIMIADPFRIKYLKVLGYGDDFILRMISLLPLGGVVSLFAWGRIADRFGNRAIFSVTLLGLFLSVTLWLFVDKSPVGSVIVVILYAIGAVSGAGHGLVQTRYLMHSVDRKAQNHLNIVNLATFITVAIAPLIGGLILTPIEGLQFDLAGRQFRHYHVILLLSSLLFIFPWRLRKTLTVDGEAPTREVVRAVSLTLRHAVGSFFVTERRRKRRSEDLV